MLKRLFLLIALVSICGFAQDLELEGKQEVPDDEILRKWIQEKRMITVKEKGGDLFLSGEVRTECQGAFEEKNSIRQRGQGSATTIPQYVFDVEVNLMLDYRTERTWSAIKIEFDNDMGTAGGTTNHIALERAYFGGRVISGDTFTFDAEIGRRNLLNVFESKLQFSSLFDGLMLKFNKAWESIGDFYLNGGVFVIYDFYKHFGEVFEIGMLRIGYTGFFLKYSFINWKKNIKGDNGITRNPYYDYRISQWIAGYQLKLANFLQLMKVYTGFLYNHCANRRPEVANKVANMGWYGGISVGRIEKAGDFAFDMNYQIAQAQVVPDFDAAGIGRGNAARVGTYTLRTDGSGGLINSSQSVGGCNFHGFEIELLYAITSNWTALTNYLHSTTLDHSIGPNMRYDKFEIEFIYAF